MWQENWFDEQESLCLINMQRTQTSGRGANTFSLHWDNINLYSQLYQVFLISFLKTFLFHCQSESKFMNKHFFLKIIRPNSFVQYAPSHTLKLAFVLCVFPPSPVNILITRKAQAIVQLNWKWGWQPLKWMQSSSSSSLRSALLFCTCNCGLKVH